MCIQRHKHVSQNYRKAPSIKFVLSNSQLLKLERGAPSRSLLVRKLILVKLLWRLQSATRATSESWSNKVRTTTVTPKSNARCSRERNGIMSKKCAPNLPKFAQSLWREPDWMKKFEVQSSVRSVRVDRVWYIFIVTAQTTATSKAKSDKKCQTNSQKSEKYCISSDIFMVPWGKQVRIATKEVWILK